MKKILGASIGSCIHVAGVLNFLNLSDKHGYSTIFLGSACKIDYLKQKIDEYDPDIVAVSYRLSPEGALPIFEELKKKGLISDYDYEVLRRQFDEADLNRKIAEERLELIEKGKIKIENTSIEWRLMSSGKVVWPAGRLNPSPGLGPALSKSFA